MLRLKRFWISAAFMGLAQFAVLCFCQLAVGAPQSAPAQQSAEPQRIPRLTIIVTGGDDNVPVENASVYVKFKIERKLKKDEKVALNVKTNREGVAHVPDPPLGGVLIQIVADRWRTYGKSFEITDSNQVIKIHLDKPPKWY
ncbi:MAG TPA: hypothetical protein VLX32_04435 [Candidatus Acidoferrum sp.]|nr:hypothetical protein [Candidatus Acidoferrum sp.]